MCPRCTKCSVRNSFSTVLIHAKNLLSLSKGFQDMGISWFYWFTILLGVHTCADNKELTAKIHREAWLFCNNLLTNHIENFIMAECLGVKTWNFQCKYKISCSFSSCYPNFHHQFHNGVTVTDLKRDMSVTEELGGCAE